MKTTKHTHTRVRTLLCLGVLLLSLLLGGCFSPAPPATTAPATTAPATTAPAADPSYLPAYAEDAYVVLNGNVPFFTTDEYPSTPFERYSELDSLGRCGVAVSLIDRSLMPTEDRESIGSVKPSGWQSVKYDHVDGKYLYNRCHLIGFQLTGENANKQNLITGTRYLNVVGMLPFEDLVADYIKETGNRVLYRITPLYAGDELVARGVLMEGWSVEDEGEGICFNVFCYNNQPGVVINYQTGESQAGDPTADRNPLPLVIPYGVATPDTTTAATDPVTTPATPPGSETSAPGTEKSLAPYLLNTSSHKFHHPDCAGAAAISPANRREVEADRLDLIAEGYSPCGQCNP